MPCRVQLNTGVLLPAYIQHFQDCFHIFEACQFFVLTTVLGSLPHFAYNMKQNSCNLFYILWLYDCLLSLSKPYCITYAVLILFPSFFILPFVLKAISCSKESVKVSAPLGSANLDSFFFPCSCVIKGCKPSYDISSYHAATDRSCWLTAAVQRYFYDSSLSCTIRKLRSEVSPLCSLLIW